AAPSRVWGRRRGGGAPGGAAARAAAPGRPGRAPPAELVAHDLVMFSPRPPPRWRLGRGGDGFAVTGPARLIVNNNLAARDAVAAGRGTRPPPPVPAAPAPRAGRAAAATPPLHAPPPAP